MATALEQDFTEAVEENEEDGSEVEQTEERARILGWKPKDEYKGDPEKWADWQSFLEQNNASIPQLKARIKLLDRRIVQYDKRFKRTEKAIEEAREYFSKAEQRAYDRALEDLQAKQRAAVAAGDEDAFDEATDRLNKLNKEAKDGKAPKAKPEIDPAVTKSFRNWERDNDWYGTDEAMTVYADHVANKMGSYADNDMEPDEYLEELTRRVKAKFPDEKPKPRRSAVEGVGETRPTKGQKTFDNLPAEAKAQCDSFVKAGILKSRDEYLKSYDW